MYTTLTFSDYQKLTQKKPEQSQTEFRLYDKTITKLTAQMESQERYTFKLSRMHQLYFSQAEYVKLNSS